MTLSPDMYFGHLPFPRKCCSGLMGETVLNKELWDVTGKTDGRGRKKTDFPTSPGTVGRGAILLLKQYFPQSMVSGPAPPWLPDQRHVKVSLPDRLLLLLEPHLRILSSHTWGWRRGRAESLSGHSEELEVSNRTFYRNEVVWGETNPP